MSGAQETGVDFVKRITAEIKVIQSDIADLRASIHAESRIQNDHVTKIHERISEERTAEAQMRTALEARLENFEAKTENSIETLDKDCAATKGQLTALGGTVSELAQKVAAQVETDDLRFKDLEQLVPTKAPQQQLQKLEKEVVMFRTEVEGRFLTTAESIRNTAAEAAHDFKMAQDGIERAQMYSEAAKMMLASEISTVTSKVETVDAFAHTRAAAMDLQELKPRIDETERSLERVNEDLNTKACDMIVSSISGRVSDLTMDLQAQQARTLADKESLVRHIGRVEQALEMHRVQQDADRERTSNVIVAVEQEIATKASKAETEVIGPDMIRAAHDAIESSAQRLEQQIAASRQEQVPYRNRLEALEVAFPTKADAVDIPRLTLALSDSNARHEAAWKRAQEHGMRLDKLSMHIDNHLVQLQSLESRGNMLDAKVSTKAEVTDHLTKDNTVGLLKEFYRKDEVDAMMSRIWWRVDGVAKGISNGPGTSQRSVMR